MPWCCSHSGCNPTPAAGAGHNADSVFTPRDVLAKLPPCIGETAGRTNNSEIPPPNGVSKDRRSLVRTSVPPNRIACASTKHGRLAEPVRAHSFRRRNASTIIRTDAYRKKQVYCWKPLVLGGGLFRTVRSLSGSSTHLHVHNGARRRVTVEIAPGNRLRTRVLQFIWSLPAARREPDKSHGAFQVARRVTAQAEPAPLARLRGSFAWNSARNFGDTQRYKHRANFDARGRHSRRFFWHLSRGP